MISSDDLIRARTVELVGPGAEVRHALHGSGARPDQRHSFALQPIQPTERRTPRLCTSSIATATKKSQREREREREWSPEAINQVC